MKKAQLANIQGLVIALVTVALALVVGFLIMSSVDTQVRETENYDGANYTLTMNATLDTQKAMAVIPGWLNIIVITAIGALLIGLVALFNRR